MGDGVHVALTRALKQNLLYLAAVAETDKHGSKVPQMRLARTLIRTSPAPGVGLAASFTSISPGQLMTSSLSDWRWTDGG